MIGKYRLKKETGITSLTYRLRTSRTIDVKISINHLKFDAKYWSPKRMLNMNCGFSNYLEINKSLMDFDYHVLQEMNKLGDQSLVNGKWLICTYQTFFGLKNQEDLPQITFIKFCDEFLKDNTRIEGQPKNGRNLKYNTVKGYKSMLNSWQGYTKAERLGDILLRDINKKTVEGYIKYGESIEKLGHNSIATHFTKLRSVLNYAIEVDSEMVHPDIVKGLKPISELKVDQIYLNDAEIQKIVDLDLSNNERLDNVRDWFVLQLNTALRVSDLLSLCASGFDSEFLEVKTGKTDVSVVIPILEQIREVIKKRDGELPRSISDVKFNKYIKEVCQMAGINDLVHGSKYKILADGKKRKVAGIYPKFELVTSHTSRRSYITKLSKIPDVTLFEIMTVSGHSSVKTLEKYVRSSAQERAISLKEKLQVI